jgi:hypothetical protein
VLTLAAVAAVVNAAPAVAQAAPTLTLVGQDPWTPAGGQVTLRVRAEGAPAGTTLALTTHEQVGSRTSFDNGLAGGNLGATIKLTQLALDELPVDPTTGARVLTVPLDELNARLNTRQSSSGVFPLEVDLRSGDRAVARFVTYLVVADVGPSGALVVGQPLRVAWVWPLRSPPAFLANGDEDPSVVAELRPDGRLGRQVGAIASNPDIPLTLAPSPDTLTTWNALAAREIPFATGVTDLRTVSAGDQILASPYVPLDLPSLIAAGLGGEIDTELQAGVSTLESFFGVLPDLSTALPGPLDPPSVAALRSASQRRLVVRGSALAGAADGQFTPAHPTTVLADPSDESTAMTVLASDEAIERLLAADEPPALRAAHVLAALAVVAGELPNRARGVAIVNPERWDAPTALMSALLTGLRGNPLLAPVTVDSLLAQVPFATAGDDPDGDRVVRQLAPVTPAAPPVSASEYARAQFARNAVANLFPSDDPRVSNGDRALLVALSSAWADVPGGRRTAERLLTGIAASVDGFLAHIRVPEPSTVTLTSNAAEIPISFDNDTGQPVRIRIRLESNRLLFPDGAERVIELPPRNHTERIRVETNGPGTFPVVVDVTTEGGLPIQTTKLSVRSSVVSGMGVVLMVGALAFLALWWGWDIHRRRRRRVRDDAIGATSPAPA